MFNLILRHLVLQPNLDKTWSLCDIISAPNFSSTKKNRQMKAGQNNKYDIIKTSGLVQV